MKPKKRCDGCGKMFNSKSIIWFLGHQLCGSCKVRKNMPLVGFKNKEAWKIEKKIINKVKDRFYPKLTWGEQQILWNKYISSGLSHREAKNRLQSMKARIAKSHWSHNPKPVEVQPC